MPATANPKPSPGARQAGLAILVALLVVVIVMIYCARVKQLARGDGYSVGYQIGPHYLSDTSTGAWAGTPYALTPERGEPQLTKNRFTGGFQPCAPPDEGPRGTDDPPELVYNPPFTRDLRGETPDWWLPDGGTYGLPPASDRPDFWAGDETLHTYHARDVIPPLCPAAAVADGDRRPTLAERVEKWRYYGGPRGWTMSPYY